MTTNRYAPPKALLEDRLDPDAEMWREGKVLVIRKGGEFPQRCIKCNEPSVLPRRLYKLSWHSPWLYLLALAALLLYAIIAAIVRKTAIIHVGLCARHQRRVLWGRIVGWGGCALEVALVWIGMAFEQPVLSTIALIFVLPWVIATIVVNRLVIPTRIEENYVRLKGCGPAFLRSLPERSRS